MTSKKSEKRKFLKPKMTTEKQKKIKQQKRNKITPGIGLPEMSDFRLSIDE